MIALWLLQLFIDYVSIIGIIYYFCKECGNYPYELNNLLLL